VSRILFVPFSVIGGLIAGKLAKTMFDGIWGSGRRQGLARARASRSPVVEVAPGAGAGGRDLPCRPRRFRSRGQAAVQPVDRHLARRGGAGAELTAQPRSNMRRRS
jgi:hypothetical protein